MQTACLCGAVEVSWFLTLLLPCDFYAAILKKNLLFVLELVVGEISAHERNEL